MKTHKFLPVKTKESPAGGLKLAHLCIVGVTLPLIRRAFFKECGCQGVCNLFNKLVINVFTRQHYKNPCAALVLLVSQQAGCSESAHCLNGVAFGARELNAANSHFLLLPGISLKVTAQTTNSYQGDVDESSGQCISHSWGPFSGVVFTMASFQCAGTTMGASPQKAHASRRPICHS